MRHCDRGPEVYHRLVAVELAITELRNDFVVLTLGQQCPRQERICFIRLVLQIKGLADLSFRRPGLSILQQRLGQKKSRFCVVGCLLQCALELNDCRPGIGFLKIGFGGSDERGGFILAAACEHNDDCKRSNGELHRSIGRGHLHSSDSMEDKMAYLRPKRCIKS